MSVKKRAFPHGTGVKPSPGATKHTSQWSWEKPIRIDSLWRIEWVVFDSVQFDYTIGITMFGNWQPLT